MARRRAFRREMRSAISRLPIGAVLAARPTLLAGARHGGDALGLPRARDGADGLDEGGLQLPETVLVRFGFCPGFKLAEAAVAGRLQSGPAFRLIPRARDMLRQSRRNTRLPCAFTQAAILSNSFCVFMDRHQPGLFWF